MEPKDANAKRTQLQRDAVTALLRDRRVMVNWGTGVGKSRVAIEAADVLFKGGALRILLLVDQSLHKENWEKEFKECKGEEYGRYLYDSLTVECYASLPTLADTSWDLIIADEAHHLRSENRCSILSTMKAERFLGLTATISCRGDGDQLIRTINETFGKMKTLEFGVQDAIDNYILGVPDIHVHVLPLDEVTANHSITIGWGPTEKRKDIECLYSERFAYTNKELYPALNLTMQCNAQEAYDYWNRQYEKLDKQYKEARKEAELGEGEKDDKRTQWIFNRRQQAALQRKNIIGRSKTRFATWLIRHLGDKKLICFCNDVDQACELGGEHVIFSGRSENLERIEKYTGAPAELFKKQDEVVAAFNKNEIRSIFAVNMLIEGQNLAGIQTGIAIQLAGKDRKFVQQLGRAMRAKDPEQHIIVIDGTRDVDYLETALSVINNNYVTFTGYGRLKGITGLSDLFNGNTGETKVTAERFSLATAKNAAMQGNDKK
jgi:superfamily II DNA or RNA helicase